MMLLRDLADGLGLVLVLASLYAGLQMLEWGIAPDPYEPDDVDAVEIPNPVDLRVQGPGVRTDRARALELERRLRVVRDPEQ